MPCTLAYYSQQGPQWKNEVLGFGDPGDAVGDVGDTLTSMAMLLSGHGFTVPPNSQKLKNAGAFCGALLRGYVDGGSVRKG